MHSQGQAPAPRYRRKLAYAAALLATACTSAPDRHAPVSDNQAIIVRFVDAYNQCDLNTAKTLLHDDAQWLAVENDVIKVMAEGKTFLIGAFASQMANGCNVRSELSEWSLNDAFVAVKETAHWQSDDGRARQQSSTAVYQLMDNTIYRVWYYPSQRSDTPAAP